MTFFIFAGDMLVMLFMIGMVIWLTAFSKEEDVQQIAHIPLEDEANNG